MLGEEGGANGLQGEEEEHACDRGQEEYATTDAFDHEGCEHCPEQVPDLQNAVD